MRREMEGGGMENRGTDLCTTESRDTCHISRVYAIALHHRVVFGHRLFSRRGSLSVDNKKRLVSTSFESILNRLRAESTSDICGRLSWPRRREHCQEFKNDF